MSEITLSKINFANKKSVDELSRTRQKLWPEITKGLNCIYSRYGIEFLDDFKDEFKKDYLLDEYAIKKDGISIGNILTYTDTRNIIIFNNHMILEEYQKQGYGTQAIKELQSIIPEDKISINFTCVDNIGAILSNLHAGMHLYGVDNGFCGELILFFSRRTKTETTKIINHLVEKKDSIETNSKVEDDSLVLTIDKSMLKNKDEKFKPVYEKLTKIFKKYLDIRIKCRAQAKVYIKEQIATIVNLKSEIECNPLNHIIFSDYKGDSLKDNNDQKSAVKLPSRIPNKC